MPLLSLFFFFEAILCLFLFWRSKKIAPLKLPEGFLFLLSIISGIILGIITNVYIWNPVTEIVLLVSSFFVIGFLNAFYLFSTRMGYMSLTSRLLQFLAIYFLCAIGLFLFADPTLEVLSKEVLLTLTLPLVSIGLPYLCYELWHKHQEKNMPVWIQSDAAPSFQIEDTLELIFMIPLYEEGEKTIEVCINAPRTKPLKDVFHAILDKVFLDKLRKNEKFGWRFYQELSSMLNMAKPLDYEQSISDLHFKDSDTIVAERTLINHQAKHYLKIAHFSKDINTSKSQVL